jgi:hypothetical protein
MRSRNLQNSFSILSSSILKQMLTLKSLGRWVPEYEQDFLWNHTREIRERRQPVLVAIEGKKKHGDVEFEFVRKKEHKRKTSPSPLLTFLAGGKR